MANRKHHALRVCGQNDEKAVCSLVSRSSLSITHSDQEEIERSLRILDPELNVLVHVDWLNG
jgi:hypothetical protein